MNLTLGLKKKKVLRPSRFCGHTLKIVFFFLHQMHKRKKNSIRQREGEHFFVMMDEFFWVDNCFFF